MSILLPTWLDEGMAVNTERRLCGGLSSAHYLEELRRKHLGLWTAETIQEFWSGRSFHRTDDGNKLSYDLARIIVGQIGKDWDRFTNFVNSAKRGDAGANAARKSLGVDLADLVGLILDPEQAEICGPRPSAWNKSSAESA